jgi:hypothetical protein
MTLIETMPLGEVDVDRTDQYLSLKDVRRDLSSFWTLTDLAYATGGPARYVRVEETGGRLGLITPLSHNFCEACNRVRLTCTGTLHTCLGRDDASDLRAVIRGGADDAGWSGRSSRPSAPSPRATTSRSTARARPWPATCRRPAADDGAGAAVRTPGRPGRLARPLRRGRVPGRPARRPGRRRSRPGRGAGGPGVQVAVDKAMVRGEAALTVRPRWPSCRR